MTLKPGCPYKLSIKYSQVVRCLFNVVGHYDLLTKRYSVESKRFLELSCSQNNIYRNCLNYLERSKLMLFNSVKRKGGTIGFRNYRSRRKLIAN